MKILLADDHELFRDGVRYILGRLDVENPPCLLESEDYACTVRLLDEQDDIELVLLDLDMPGMRHTLGVARLVERCPTLPFVVLSAAENPGDVQGSLEAGAAGFVPKSSSSEVLLGAVKLVLAGGIYAPRAAAHGALRGGVHAAVAAPTGRQREVLACLAEGLPNKEIARQLFLAESTIKGHVRGLMQMLDVSNRVQAINKARALGYLPR